ncbi:MAG: hypothetical protein K2G24_03085 [Muribaculaceae bacterium]|nr:hypothetical protein [Muribaculaceae bacterium]
MPEQINIIGIGGTGMRCVESFIHLCAMGMFDDTEVNILALDTDIANGNFKRVRELVGNYNKVNGGKALSDTFFSAKINYNEFSPEYGEETTFDSISDYSTAQKRSIGGNEAFHESDIVDLFLTKEVRGMSLHHGYRAQTQMGSMLMYHAIIEAAEKVAENPQRPSGLRNFLSYLKEGTKHKVFIFGSVFGGTGASSIPILPEALNIAAKLIFSNPDINILNGNYFGSVVLTGYFTFDYRKGGEVSADASKFALNSQAALMFYRSDPTVEKTYNRLYLIGRDSSVKLPSDTGFDTGGEKQKTPVDYIELLAAFAAYDFFKESKKDKAFERQQDESIFYYMQADENERLDFINFTDDNAKFKNRFGCFVAAAMTNARGDFFRQMANQYLKSIKEKEELEPLNNFIKAFYDASAHSGWAQQMYDSAGAQGMLFHPNVFDKGIDIRKKKYNKEMFYGDSPEQFSASGLFGDALWDKVRNTFEKETDASKNQTMGHLMERTYATFNKLYFNK